MPAPHSDTHDNGRVTMKDVARRAGVSPSTVCRSLNSNPQINEATRERVRRVAEEMGYRPDPLLSAFASRRRSRNPDSQVTTIAYVTNFSEREEWKKNPFYRSCYQGACDRLEGMGYKLEHFWLGEATMNPMRLSKILYNRGILGLFIAPMPHVWEPLEMDWSRFSPVTLGYSLMSPTLHRSTPHHFHAVRETLARLKQLGYQRIGLCLFSDTSRRVDELWLSGALVAQYREQTGPHISTFLFNDSTLEETPDWCRREQLDVVISDDLTVLEALKAAGISVPGEVDFASLSWSEEFEDIAGIDQRPADIGAAAMDIIISSMQRGERGVPAVPLTTMVEGRWIDGPSVRQQ